VFPREPSGRRRCGREAAAVEPQAIQRWAEISEAKIGSDEQIFSVIEQTSGDQSDYRAISLKVILDTFSENALEAD
jgi:hypothetical protein